MAQTRPPCPVILADSYGTIVGIALDHRESLRALAHERGLGLDDAALCRGRC